MPGATMSDTAILGVLNAINHSAIAAGQLAKDRASSDEVQRYASRMVNEHERQREKTNQLAHQFSLGPQKPALDSTYQNTYQNALEDLRDNAGPQFDNVYIEYQIRMHEQAANLVEAAAYSVKRPEFKKFLREVGPDLQRHLKAALSVQGLILSGE